LQREIPPEYRAHLRHRAQAMLAGGQQRVTFRGFLIGAFLSFFLAIGAPYANMIVRGTYMSLDFSTPGAIFLFLFLIGVLNAVLKLARRLRTAAALCAALSTGWIAAYWPGAALDWYSPGLLFSTFLVVLSAVNVVAAVRGRSMALNRSDLILVYVMLLIVSALCTMGLSEQILPMLTAVFYYASPQNRWAEKLLPHLPRRHVMVNDGVDNRLFYEGLGSAGASAP